MIIDTVSSLKSDTRCSTRYHQQFLNNLVSRSMYLNSADAGRIHKTINGFKNKATRDTKIDAFKIAKSSITLQTLKCFSYEISLSKKVYFLITSFPNSKANKSS